MESTESSFSATGGSHPPALITIRVIANARTAPMNRPERAQGWTIYALTCGPFRVFARCVSVAAAIVLPPLTHPCLAWDERELLAVAHSAVQAEVHGHGYPPPDGSTPARPVFVTIERAGRVMGCRGSLDIRTGSLEEEVALAAREAAGHDARYRPLTEADLKGALITITIVMNVSSIEDVRGLTPAEGLVLKGGGRAGIVLPWEGSDPRTRLAWAYKKAGVPQGAACTLFRMVADRMRG